ncbi:hypothetical protein D1872_255410 [compost metagenome]
MAVHRDGVGAQNIAGLIEGVDRHIEQKRAVHGIAKSAEMRADKKVRADKAGPPDRFLADEAAERADVRVKAAVLHDGMDFAAFPR